MNENLFENNYLIWKLLASTNATLTTNEISLETGLESQAVRISLAKLSSEKLIEKIEKNSYKINKQLTALQWAKSVELGVDISLLEQYAQLKNSQEDSLLVTMDGTLEEHDNNVLKKKIQTRNDFIEGKAATEAAKTDLSKIVNDTENALKNIENKSDVVKEILMAANDEAKSALQTLVTNYIKRRS